MSRTSDQSSMRPKKELSCQGCGSDSLDRVLDLGHQPLCNEFISISEPSGPQTYYPSCLCYCLDCSLVQLDYVIPTDATFGDQYTYLTGSSPSLITYYSELACRLTEQFDLHPGDVVIEIGSNDGTFLKEFKTLGMTVLGIEGASRSSDLAEHAGVPVIKKFFGKGIAEEVNGRLPTGSEIKLILAMNVLAHTDNVNEFLAEVTTLMGRDAIFVSQSHWLMALIRECEFDTIYHEHLRYYTMHSLMQLKKRHGLHVFDGELTDFYGGSILDYARIQPSTRSTRLAKILEDESHVNVPDSLMAMKNTLVKNKAALLALLIKLKMSGKKVVGVGAPMKASTLLNFYGITPDLMEYVAEVNDLKVGTVVPGVRIPVIHEDKLFEDPPDYAVLLSWNMAQHIIRNYRKKGYTGKFIMPVPEPEVIDE